MYNAEILRIRRQRKENKFRDSALVEPGGLQNNQEVTEEQESLEEPIGEIDEGNVIGSGHLQTNSEEWELLDV